MSSRLVLSLVSCELFMLQWRKIMLKYFHYHQDLYEVVGEAGQLVTFLVPEGRCGNEVLFVRNS